MQVFAHIAAVIVDIVVAYLIIRRSNKHHDYQYRCLLPHSCQHCHRVGQTILEMMLDVLLLGNYSGTAMIAFSLQATLLAFRQLSVLVARTIGTV